MKLTELFEKSDRYVRGLKKSRSLRDVKDKQFKDKDKDIKSAFEVQG